MFLLDTHVVSELRNMRVDRADPRPFRKAPIVAAALVHRIIKRCVAIAGERVGTVNYLTLK